MELFLFLLVGAIVGIVFGMMQSTTRKLEQSTSLHVAAEAGYTHSIEELIVEGANVNSYRHGYTPLHGAAAAGHVQAINSLIAAGADLNSRDKESGLVPLHLAALEGHGAAIETLIAAGTNVNAVDGGSQGATPLHCAALQGHAEAIKILIAAGADLNARDSQGRTPLRLATNPPTGSGSSHAVAVEALLEEGATK